MRKEQRELDKRRADLERAKGEAYKATTDEVRDANTLQNALAHEPADPSWVASARLDHARSVRELSRCAAQLVDAVNNYELRAWSFGVLERVRLANQRRRART